MSPVRDDEMGTALQQTPFQCDQCGARNIVAAPVVYQQGTHTYSSRFNFGTSQTFAAQVAAPPNPRGYRRPSLIWGLPACFTLFWGLAGLGRTLNHPQSAANLGGAVAIFLLLGCIFLGGLLLSFHRVARYNREVYPQLLWNWEHTYICRRCGKFQLIPF